MSASKQLGQRLVDLEAQGADPLRLELLKRSRSFKRSWIDMAEALLQLRVSRAYERWGYKELYSYCSEELLLKRRTVDKLTGSYQAVEEHAPAMLKPNAYAGSLPPLDAVDYFARAVTAREDAPPPAASEKVVEELHEAVFSEGRPLRALRKQFDEVLYPKSPEQESLTSMRRANLAAQRLRRLLAEIEGLSRGRSDEVSATLSRLEAELEPLILAAQERLERIAA